MAKSGWSVSFSFKQFYTSLQIEYQDGNKDISIETNMKQTVYVYKCVNSTIRVNGKGPDFKSLIQYYIQ